MTDRKLQALKRKLQARGKSLLRPTRGVRVTSLRKVKAKGKRDDR